MDLLWVDGGSAVRIDFYVAERFPAAIWDRRRGWGRWRGSDLAGWNGGETGGFNGRADSDAYAGERRHGQRGVPQIKRADWLRALGAGAGGL